MAGISLTPAGQQAQWTPADFAWGSTPAGGLNLAGSTDLGAGLLGSQTSVLGNGAKGFDLTGASKIGQGVGGSFLDGLGFNLDTAKLGLSGLGTLGSLYGAFQSQKLAKEQFEYTKKTTDKNMANQVQSYNTALDDRINSRAVQQGNMSAQDIANYKAANRLTT